MRLLLFFFLFTSLAFTQTVRIDQTITDTEISITEADYQLSVCGPLTEINATLTVYNKNTIAEKATFFYKLPKVASVTGFALDIMGRMRKASAVDKEKARIAFESEVRRKVDPAVIEWNQGNIFQTQIYPIPENGVRKITVSYIIPTEAITEIPLQFARLKKFTFAVSSESPISIEAPAKMKELSNSDNTLIELREENFVVDGVFKINNKSANQKLFAEQNKDQNIYWIYKEKLALPVKKIDLDKINTIALFQDTSLSRESANIQKELEFIGALLKKINRPVIIKLYRFNFGCEFLKEFKISSDNHLKEFSSAYKNFTADGGTDFSKLTPSLKLSSADLKIIFSDGLNNFSDFTSDEKVFTITSSSETDSYTLKAFGNKNMDLTQLNITDALKTFISKPYSLKTNNPDTFGDVTNGQLIVAGLIKPGQKVEISIILDDIEVKKVLVKPEAEYDSDIIRKFWIQKKLAKLMKNSVKNRAEITELGKSHSLVTPYTSLIVMENLRQYVEYEIRPSDDEPDLQARYDETMKNYKKPVAVNQMAIITEEWEKYKGWWEKYSEKKQTKPLVVKIDKKMTPIDQAITQLQTERQNENHNNPPSPPSNIPEESIVKAPPSQVPEESESMTQRESDELLDSMNLTKEKRGQIDARINNLYEKIEELNKENDGLKNDNGRLKAQNKRITSYLEELKELYVKDRNVVAARKTRANGDSITLTKWSSSSPVIKSLITSSEPYKEYLNLRNKHRNLPGFYFECAEYFLSKGDKKNAYLMLTNIVEVSNRNSTLLRMAAYRMVDAEFLDEAIYILREIIKLRPEEPHSYRDLALTLVKKADQSKEILVREPLYTEALSLYKKIIESSWYRTGEFRGLSTILIEEYNNIILKSSKKFDLAPVLKNNLDMDLRVVISWDTDMADLDLHVVQPDYETVFFNNRVSKAGGRMSYDFTRGLGPETYGIRNAIPGEYKIFGNLYDANALFFNGQVSVKIDIYLNYGRPNQVHKSTTVKITEAKKEIRLATINLD